MVDKMKKRNIKIDILIFFIISIMLLCLIFFVSASDIFKPITINEDLDNEINFACIKIISDEFNIQYNITNRENVTVADILFECAEYHNFSIEKRYWTGYDSYFIESIKNLKNGNDNRYWQYYVNEEYSDVGCNNYYLQNLDEVEWRFEKSSWG
jgi:hypothetical protein